MEFRYWVTDWEPFDYFSTLFSDPFHEGLKLHETYALTPTETGTEVRYTMGHALDADGVRHEKEEGEVAAFLAAFWPTAFDTLDGLIRKTGRA